MISENEPQHAQQLLPPEQGGFGLDAMWNDDFHHAARVALTGTRDGYFGDYTGRAQEFVSCVRRGFLYQGQWYPWQKKTRGQAVPGLPAWSTIVFLQNHDQVGNTFLGDRVHANAAPGRYRALMALTLLGPQTPMLFMGQEFAASARFMFFADHHEELAALVHKGRREFLSQFRAYADEATQQRVPAPHDEATFVDSKLDWSEAEHTRGRARISIAICSSCAPAIRSSRSRIWRRSTAPRSRSRRSCCAGSTPSTAIACS